MTDKPIAYTADGRPLFDNTPTVVAVLAVIYSRLIVVRRNNEPGRGLLGLPGGYHMRGESWQEAGCRELREETGHVFDPAGMNLISMVTDEYGNNLVIAYNDRPKQLLRVSEHDPKEVQELLYLDHPGAPEDWAFPRHYEAARRYYYGMDDE